MQTSSGVPFHWLGNRADQSNRPANSVAPAQGPSNQTVASPRTPPPGPGAVAPTRTAAPSLTFRKVIFASTPAVASAVNPSKCAPEKAVEAGKPWMERYIAAPHADRPL